MPIIQISESESRLHGYQIGRTPLIDNMNARDLRKEIFKSQLDVCKMKIRIGDEDVFNKISEIGFPYAYYTLLIRTTYEIEKFEGVHNPDIKIKIYREKDGLNISAHIQEIVANQTALYYAHPLYHAIFNKETTEEAFKNHYLSFDNDVNPDKFCFMVSYQGKLFGIGIIQVNGSEAEGIDVGILPEYRGNRFFIEMMQALMLEFKHSGSDSSLSKCTSFSYNTVLFNPRSLNTSLKFGFKITDALLNVNIFSMLGHAMNNAVFVKCLQRDLVHCVNQVAFKNKWVNDNSMILTHFIYKPEKYFNENCEWKVYPIMLGEEMVVIGFYNPINYECGYLEYNRQ